MNFYIVKPSKNFAKEVIAIKDYYEKQEKDLGLKFEIELLEHLSFLEMAPFYQIRYDNTRCLPLRKFPYMLHFTIDDRIKVVRVRAILHTSRKLSPSKNQ